MQQSTEYNPDKEIEIRKTAKEIADFYEDQERKFIRQELKVFAERSR